MLALRTRSIWNTKLERCAAAAENLLSIPVRGFLEPQNVSQGSGGDATAAVKATHTHYLNLSSGRQWHCKHSECLIGSFSVYVSSLS